MSGWEQKETMSGKTDELKRMPTEKNIVQWLLRLFHKDGQHGKWPLRIGVLGATVLLLCGFFSEGEASDTSTEPQNTAFAAEVYEQELEQRLVQLLSRVEGAGEVAVMVTLENGTQAVYAQAVQQSSDIAAAQSNGGSERTSYTAEVVLIDTDGGEEALKETTLQPTVKGVAVVCTGAHQLHVVSRITELVSTVLGIPSNRICVTN